MAELEPLCFVLMPFGQKADPLGAGRPPIDFDRIYREAIEPAIRRAEMVPLRADQERTGGVIHQPMFERLLLCDYAIADLTTANANVFYELGIRHAARPRTTLPIFGAHQPIPFDLGLVRGLSYELGTRNEFDEHHAQPLRDALASRLQQLRQLSREEQAVDSPLFQLLTEYRPGDLAHLKTDVFRDRVRYAEEYRQRLAHARSLGDQEGRAELDSIRDELSPLDAVETGVVVDLFLSYRALRAWDGMVSLYEQLPLALQRTVMVREQLALALNRRAALDRTDRQSRHRALELLQGVENEQGPTAETCGLQGRVYKDLWEEALDQGNAVGARGYLNLAVQAYRKGFEADLRDAYPGINAVTLLEIQGDDASLAEQARLLPVVRFAAELRLRAAQPDYWDHATLLELSVLTNDSGEAEHHLANALVVVRESWEPETTARNLRLIQEARLRREAPTDWLEPLIHALLATAGLDQQREQ
jgi:hypothetical protein